MKWSGRKYQHTYYLSFELISLSLHWLPRYSKKRGLHQNQHWKLTLATVLSSTVADCMWRDLLDSSDIIYSNLWRPLDSTPSCCWEGSIICRLLVIAALSPAINASLSCFKYEVLWYHYQYHSKFRNTRYEATKLMSINPPNKRSVKRHHFKICKKKTKNLTVCATDFEPSTDECRQENCYHARVWSFLLTIGRTNLHSTYTVCCWTYPQDCIRAYLAWLCFWGWLHRIQMYDLNSEFAHQTCEQQTVNISCSRLMRSTLFTANNIL